MHKMYTDCGEFVLHEASDVLIYPMFVQTCCVFLWIHKILKNVSDKHDIRHP